MHETDTSIPLKHLRIYDGDELVRDDLRRRRTAPRRVRQHARSSTSTEPGAGAVPVVVGEWDPLEIRQDSLTYGRQSRYLDDMSEDGGVKVEVGLGIAGDWHERPLAVVSGIAKGTKAMETTLREAVHLAREQGASWDEVGRALGVSRQAAWERFSRD